MIIRHILVTAISGDIANGILKILAEDDLNELYGCDVNSVAIGMDKVRHYWQCKYAHEDGYIDELLEKCMYYKISHLIVTNEREIEAVSGKIKRFSELGIKITIQSKDILEICLDKYKTMEFLKRGGISVPNSYISINNILWDEGKKYILKPRKSNGSKGIRIIDHKESLTEDELEGYLLQEYIEGNDEYTLGVFRQGSVTNIIVFKRMLRSGYSYRVELKKNKEMEDLAEKVANLFSLEGFFNIQLIKKDDKLYIFEINPRISGTVRFRHMLGFKDVLWWLDMLDGKNVEEYICHFDIAVGIRELNEKFLVLETKTKKGGAV